MGFLPDNMNIGDLLQSAQKMQADLLQAKEELKKKEVETSSGGGVVTALVRGDGTLASIKLDPVVVDARDIAMLQDLIVAAVNEGVRKSQDLMKDELKKLTGGIPIPGLTA